MPKRVKKKMSAHVVSVSMGYGHERAAYPLLSLCNKKGLNANFYTGIPERDRKIWLQSQEFYESISRASHIPLVGKWLFSLFDQWQKISSFYPRRNLSRPNFQTQQTYRLIEKGWGKDLIQRLARRPLPLVTTFFVPAFMAEVHHYPGEIYCVVCDADISRNWAPLDPARSRIRYLAPTLRVMERFKLYGVPARQIFVTGFPLPRENIGGSSFEIAKMDLVARVPFLDPTMHFRKNYHDVLKHHFGQTKKVRVNKRLLTLTFAVGGAGAQRELGVTLLRSLKGVLLEGRLRLCLVAGSREDVAEFFRQAIDELKLTSLLTKNLIILFDQQKHAYFQKFNQMLRQTDILWTKPSELVFYAGLGIPLILAAPIGSQEVFNQRWLVSIGGGIPQEDPRYTHEWLFDWLNSGWLAEAALQGFLDASKLGVKNIESIVSGRGMEIKDAIELL